MFRSFLFLLVPALFFFLSLGKVNGQTDALSPEQASSLPPSLLWRIEGEGLKSSYLYGSFHILPKADFQVSEQAFDAFMNSPQIVMELDMDDPNMNAEVMKHLPMENNVTLDQLLDEDDYNKLDSLLKASYGMGVAIFNNVPPMVIGAMLIRNHIEGELVSFEDAFLEFAATYNKEVLGLETPAEQMAIFNETPYEGQIKELQKMMNEDEEIKAMYDRMIEMYKKEDIAGLFDYMKSYYNEQQDMDRLLNVRNINWVPKIIDYSMETSTFFLVGAGHLAGEQGLIALLRKEGLTLTPVN